MNESSRLRVAIVGAGLMGRWHARAAARAGAKIVGVVDSDHARAIQLCAHHSGARTSRDLDDILDHVDVVHICTPSATHVPLATRALAARRHVLVEKPLAPTADGVVALLDLAAQHGVLLCPVHQFPFQVGVQRAIARVPVIAPLYHIALTTCSAGAERADPRQAGQVAVEILPHFLSLITKLLPAVEEIEWSVRRPGAGEIRALAQVGEVSISLLISMSGRPTCNALELLGARGTTHVDLFHGFAVTYPGGVSRLRKATQPFTFAARTAGAAALNLAWRALRREPAYPGLRRLLEAFYEAVADNGACPVPPAEALGIARAGDRLRELLSAEDGKAGS